MRNLRIPKGLALTLSLVVLAGVSWLLATRIRQDDETAVARKILVALEVGDTHQLFGAMTSEDVKAYGLSESKFRRFFEKYITPLKLSSAGDLSFESDSGTVLVGRPFNTSNGMTSEWGFTVARTEEGVKSPSLMAILLVKVFEVHYDKSKPVTKLGPRSDSWVQFPMYHKAELEALGFPGIYRSPEEGMIGWDAWIAKFKLRESKMDSD